MKGYLLDINVLLALAWPNHPQHVAAEKWFSSNQKKGWATCDVTQLAFVRLSTHPQFSAVPQTIAAALALLKEITVLKGHQYWQEEKTGLIGKLFGQVSENILTHATVTDGFLVSVAITNHGKLATFDQGARRSFGESVELIKAG